MKAAPLFNIDTTHIIPDELHMTMRIVDRLLTASITACQQQDRQVNRSKKRGQPAGNYVDQFKEEVSK